MARLIDADALKRKIEKSGVDGTIANYARRVLAATLDNEPTVDAAPVVHGLWEEKTVHMGFVCCSVCNDCYVDKEWIFGTKWGWCPQCGARMDGGENGAGQ